MGMTANRDVRWFAKQSPAIKKKAVYFFFASTYRSSDTSVRLSEYISATVARFQLRYENPASREPNTEAAVFFVRVWIRRKRKNTAKAPAIEENIFMLCAGFKPATPPRIIKSFPVIMYRGYPGEWAMLKVAAEVISSPLSLYGGTVGQAVRT
jgi:hypothetical protein